MRSNIKETYFEWFKFSKSINGIYQELINLEIDGLQHTQEYYDMYLLLKDAIKFEKNRYAHLDLKKDKDRIISMFFNNIDQVSKDFFLFNDNGKEELRIYNIIETIVNNEFDEFSANSFTELINSIQNYNKIMNKKYSDIYLLEVSRYLLNIIDMEANKTDDLEYKKHIIKFKYDIIYTNPLLEKLFIEGELNNLFVPIGNMAYRVPQLSEEEFLTITKKNLMTSILSNIYNIMFMSDDLLTSEEMKTNLYRFRIYILTWSTILNDKEFMGLIYQDVNNNILTAGLYDAVSKDIIYKVLADSENLLEKHNKSRIV